MKQLLEDVLEVLNALPNRKLRGKDWTTYDLAKRVEQEIEKQNNMEQNIKMNIVRDNLHQLNQQLKDTYKC